jgi:hypothetical protein
MMTLDDMRVARLEAAARIRKQITTWYHHKDGDNSFWSPHRNENYELIEVTSNYPFKE